MKGGNTEILEKCGLDEYKQKLLDYIFKNYENVVKLGKGGEYIEIDLIPNSHNGLHKGQEILESCENNNIDIYMLTRSYQMDIGDGIRRGKYWFYAEVTTKKILNDLIYLIRDSSLESLLEE